LAGKPVNERYAEWTTTFSESADTGYSEIMEYRDIQKITLEILINLGNETDIYIQIIEFMICMKVVMVYRIMQNLC